MDLDVLTGSSMEIAACILVRNISDPSQLLRSNPPEWKFYPDHLYPGLTLSVNASCQAETPEFFFINFAFAKKSDLFFKCYDVACNDGVTQVFQFRTKTLHV